MNKLTPDQRFAAALGALAEVFRVQLTPLLVEAYHEALRQWPIDALTGAARELIRNNRYFPRPVEWAEAAEEWLRERDRVTAQERLSLAQSTAPPLTKHDVQAIMAELSERLEWNPKPVSAQEFEARRQRALEQARQLLEEQGDGEIPRA
jgi:hypothetical protein